MMRSSRVFYLSLFNDCNQVCRDSKFETCFKYARTEIEVHTSISLSYHIESNTEIFKGKSTTRSESYDT